MMDALLDRIGQLPGIGGRENAKYVLAIFFSVVVLLIYPFVLKAVSLRTSHEWSDHDPDLLSQKQVALEKEMVKFDSQLSAMIPKAYLVINTSSNEFSLYRNRELVKNDKCSTGSYVLLKKGDKQQWMFKTPKGEFRIRNKNTSPVWKKPDWAFVEEGLPVPSPNHPSRFEYGVLGDYSLSLGQGYLIHGTLYQRFLGLPVTHGCVRLNDENLELVYKSLNIGAKVYIF